MFLGRVVEPGEPLWLEDDRAWALALQALEADRCPGCGQPQAESMATTRNEYGRVIQAHIYQADHLICYACRAKDQYADELRKAGDTDGKYVTVAKSR